MVLVQTVFGCSLKNSKGCGGFCKAIAVSVPSENQTYLGNGRTFTALCLGGFGSLLLVLEACCRSCSCRCVGADPADTSLSAHAHVSSSLGLPWSVTSSMCDTQRGGFWQGLGAGGKRGKWSKTTVSLG